MASDWVFHPESNRWFRSIYDHSGGYHLLCGYRSLADQDKKNLCYERDHFGGMLTHAPGANQVASVTPRQRSSSGSAFPKSDDAYGHLTSFVPGSDHYASRSDLHHQSVQFECGAYAHDQQVEFNPREYEETIDHHCVDSGTYSGAGQVTSSKASSPPEWDPSEAQCDMPRGSTGHKAGRTSLSDRSEATASSRSDASIPQFNEDLQGLDLGDHPVSHNVPAYGASSRSQRHDPILGEAQRKYDKEVSLEPSYVIPGSNGERETLDPRYKRQTDPRILPNWQGVFDAMA